MYLKNDVVHYYFSVTVTVSQSHRLVSTQWLTVVIARARLVTLTTAIRIVVVVVLLNTE